MGKKNWTGCLAVLVFIAMQGAAWAADGKWLRAESPHFIVYGTQSEKVVTDAIWRLEIYDSVLRYMTHTPASATAPKLKVYMLRSHSDLATAMPDIDDDIQGVYTSSVEGVVDLTVFGRVDVDQGLGGVETLFHEYAHHFMWYYAPAAYPEWYVEGFAEYFATTRIHNDVVDVGCIPDYRALDLVYGSWLPLRSVLFDSLEGIKPAKRSQFYAQSWLLTHYMFEDNDRNLKLQQFMHVLNEGVAPEEAFRSSFGMEVEALDQALREYARGHLVYAKLDRSKVQMVVPLGITHLPESYDNLMLLELRLTIGTAPKDRDKTLASVQKYASRFPDDPFAQRTLTRAEITAGAYDVAAAQADCSARADSQRSGLALFKGADLFDKSVSHAVRLDGQCPDCEAGIRPGTHGPPS